MHTGSSLVFLLAAVACTPSVEVPTEDLEPAERSEPPTDASVIAIEAPAPLPLDELPEPLATPAVARVFVATSDEGEARVRVSGFPALRGDGRVVVVLNEGDYDARFVFLDARTGRVLRSDPFPEHAADPYAEEVEWVIDHAAVERIAARLERQGFAALGQLALANGSEDESAGTSVRFASASLVVEATTSLGDDGPSTAVVIDDLLRGARIERSETADELSAVSVSPDGSFLLLHESFCACECAFWSTLVALPSSQ